MATADPELLVIAGLTSAFPDAYVATDLPDDLQTLPFAIQVNRAGGPSTFRLARPRMVIKSYASGSANQGATIRAAALTQAKAVDEWMLFTLRGMSIAGQTCSSVVCNSGPTFIPDADDLIRGFTSTYILAVRA